VRLIASSGSSPVSLADIGKAADYSRGIVTHQFGTRDEMLRQVAPASAGVLALRVTLGRR
jgi:AcrR family transcriptional regulator